MRFASSALSLFAIAALLPAQQPSKVIVTPPAPTNQQNYCPGVLTAQQQSLPEARWTLALEDKDKPGNASQPGSSGVHVEYRLPKSAVRQIELSVDYLPPGTRFMPIEGSESNNAPEQTKTFDLATPEASKTIEGDLLIGRIAGITRLHLLSVQFADGTSWKAATANTCSVEPNRVLLVGSR